MARDPGLEELVREALGAEPGLDEKRMFGGLAVPCRAGSGPGRPPMATTRCAGGCSTPRSPSSAPCRRNSYSRSSTKSARSTTVIFGSTTTS
jgi:hypothetical protein